MITRHRDTWSLYIIIISVPHIMVIHLEQTSSSTTLTNNIHTHTQPTELVGSMKIRRQGFKEKSECT